MTARVLLEGDGHWVIDEDCGLEAAWGSNRIGSHLAAREHNATEHGIAAP